MSEPITDWGAMLDQARTGFRDLADLLATYRDLLLEEGFTREEAIQMVIAYQRGMQTS